MSNLHHDTSEMNVLFVHSAVDDYPLSPEEFRVYAHIARRAGLGEAWPSIATVAKRCRINDKTARRCLQGLVLYGLIAREDRGHLGKTNLYRITKFSAWKKPAEAMQIQAEQADLGKVKRATKLTPSQTRPPLPNETPPPKRNQGGASQTRPPLPSQTRPGEVNPLKEIPLKELQHRGVIDLEEDARANPAQATPGGEVMIQASQSADAPNSSSKNASLQTSTTPQQAPMAVALLERPAASPTAADTARELLALTDQDFDELLGAGNVDDQAPEKVAGAAAESPAAAPQVAALVPVSRSILAARPVAPVASETYRGIKAMVGKHKVDELLSELTVTGGYSRQDWLRLLPDEITLVREAACSEARQQGGSMVTFAARGLDRMIGAVSSQKPQQRALQANGAAYIVREKPVVQVEEPSEGKYEVGARYQPKAGGAEVRLVGLETVKSKITGGGARYRLSDGQVMGMLELIGRFEFVGQKGPFERGP